MAAEPMTENGTILPGTALHRLNAAVAVTSWGDTATVLAGDLADVCDAADVDPKNKPLADLRAQAAAAEKATTPVRVKAADVRRLIDAATGRKPAPVVPRPTD